MDESPTIASSSSPDRNETAAERSDRKFADILQELRVALSGTQLTSGFLLAVAFQAGFSDLDTDARIHYLVLVGMAAVATLLGLTPVIVHRLHSGKKIKDSVVIMANRLLIATLVVVSLLMVGVTSFIFEVVVSEAAGLWAAGVSLVIILGLWALAASSRQLT